MVNVVNRSMYPVQTSMNLISKMQERFATLQTQLATGQKASSLAEMGADRFITLSMQSRVSRITGYQNSINMVNMRLEVYDQVMGRLDKVEASARGAITPSAYGTANINFGTAPTTARSNLDEVINLLNSDVDGRHLFAGGSVDKRPVESLSTLLDGGNGKAGFVAVAAERLQADSGDGLGRLTLASAGDSVTLTEDGAHPFGLKLSVHSATGSGVAVTGTSGNPADSASIAVGAQPLEGDTITLGFTLPDGTDHHVTLRAVSGTPAAGEYQIGADTSETAGNLAATLEGKLQALVKTEMASASNFAAADDFFNGQGDPVMRVQGSPLATATTLGPADPTTTVIWYKGENAANPRTTVSAKIDDAASVNYGAQANESGPLALIRSLAVLAIQSFTNADETSKGRFDAVANRNYSRLSETHNNEAGSIEMIATELGNARVNVDNVSSRQNSYKAQLEGMIEDINTVPKEDVAMEILALQTRLQASYQATSLIASLSLVNYLK